jgi:formate dehydrogenase maturation protein FdhE
MTWGTLAVDAAKTVLPFAAAALTGLITKGWQYLISLEQRAKLSKDAQANALIQQGLEWATTEAKTVVEDAVNMVNQTLVNKAKAEGTWNATAAVQAFQAALTAAEHNLSTQAKAVLAKEFPNLSDYLGLLIEAFVPQAPTKPPASSNPVHSS